MHDKLILCYSKLKQVFDKRMGMNSIKIRNHITICMSYKIFSANGQYVLCKCTDQFSAPLSRNVKNVFGRPTVMFYFLLVKVQLYM